jgi:hypothetical protein
MLPRGFRFDCARSCCWLSQVRVRGGRHTLTSGVGCSETYCILSQAYQEPPIHRLTSDWNGSRGDSRQLDHEGSHANPAYHHSSRGARLQPSGEVYVHWNGSQNCAVVVDNDENAFSIGMEMYECAASACVGHCVDVQWDLELATTGYLGNGIYGC